MIGDAVAEAAALRRAQIPPLPMLERDAEKLKAEIDALLDRARHEAAELENPLSHGWPWPAATRLCEIRKLLARAHCELIPHEDPRHLAARRTAEYLAHRAPTVVLEGMRRAGQRKARAA